MSNIKLAKGFTVVEMLVVIVIISILAATTILAYGGLQKSARDEERIADVKLLQNSLEMYKYKHGSFPNTVPNPGLSGPGTGNWEVSTDTGFMTSLDETLGGEVISAPNNTGSKYRYHRFDAGANGCSAALGQYYVLWAEGMESQSTIKRDVGPCAGFNLFGLSSPEDIPSNYVVLGF